MLKHKTLFVISDFLREVYEICAFLGYYTTYSGNSLPTFRDNLLVPEERRSHSAADHVIRQNYVLLL